MYTAGHVTCSLPFFFFRIGQAQHEEKLDFKKKRAARKIKACQPWPWHRRKPEPKVWLMVIGCDWNMRKHMENLGRT